MNVICFRLPGAEIELTQRGHDDFVVRYGLQRNAGDYDKACSLLGEAILHHLTCEGTIVCEDD